MKSDDDFGGLGRLELAALGTAGGWAVLAGLLLLVSSPPEGAAGDAMRTVVGLFVLLLPLALALVGIVAHRAGRQATMAAERVTDAADALRHLALVDRQGRSARVTGAPAQDAPMPSTGTIRKTSRPSPAAPPPPDAAPPATFSSRRPDTARKEPPRAPAAAHGAQPSLDLGGDTGRDAPMEDLIVALNFPETPDDAAGFDALRRALRDGRAAPLLRQAQDVLTLLSQDGIYADDLIPDRARPELWRRFAGGERGGMMGSLGGIRDREPIALVARRMRDDIIFRDSAHHFLRSFDRTFATLEPDATDEDLSRLTDTRSARAFMLIGRAAGIFD